MLDDIHAREKERESEISFVEVLSLFFLLLWCFLLLSNSKSTSDVHISRQFSNWLKYHFHPACKMRLMFFSNWSKEKNECITNDHDESIGIIRASYLFCARLSYVRKVSKPFMIIVNEKVNPVGFSFLSASFQIFDQIFFDL